jgi:photosystem II stability/assembly factor-like uncharacterized protein
MNTRYFFLSAFLLFIFLTAAISQPSEQQLFQSFSWRNIGPANQGGRIVDIEAVERDFTKVFLATGSGGVWKSENAGNSWKPIFESYETASIGDIAINQTNPDIIWVGTGEANNRNSVSWGHGVYKSTDGGESFQNIGLEETHQIARVVLHPDNPEIAYVAAIGHLWGYKGDRGLFQTVDGGENWTKLTDGLPDDGKTGCTDLVMDPRNPRVLYAAFYHRLRQPWHFHSGGMSGGIFKSTNGGKTWKKLQNGLPTGEIGRIGLSIYRKNPKIIMAIIEAKRSDTLAVPGSGIYRSENGGKNWEYVNTYNNRPFYYSQIRINPSDDQRVYILTTRFMISVDGGKTLTNGSLDQEVHGDFHAMWFDPDNPDRYYLGADKGMSITHDHGKNFTLFDNVAIGQFYRINVDHRDPYYVYGGLQDNGTYGVASFSRDARGILNDSNWKLHWGDGQFINIDPDNWRKIYTSTENGSSMSYDPLTHIISSIKPAPATIINYTEMIPDSLQKSGRELRYNWTSPLVMSPRDANTLYAGANHVLVSTNGGKNWRIISPDLTTNDPDKRVRGKSGGITPDNSGAEQHCAIYTLSLSSIDPDIIWIGTDDGNVHFTNDGGAHWNDVRANIPDVPPGIWVSRIEASHHDPASAYVSFDGHRSDLNHPWVFRTNDFGQSWTNIGLSLPTDEVVRVVREDSRNPNLLFLGTETGVYISLSGGDSWFKSNLPTVSVYDLKTHPRDHDLIAGTHGRSIWVMDDISPLQQLNQDVLQQEAHLFSQKQATIWQNTSRGGQRGHFVYAGENPATIINTSSIPRARFKNSAMISYYLGRDFIDSPILSIKDMHGNKVRITLDSTAGIHRVFWDLEFETEWLSDSQVTMIDSIFKDLLKRTTFSSVRRAYSRFKQAETPKMQRRAINILQSGYFDAQLGPSYAIPTADSGIYMLELHAGSEVYKSTLSIRADPLLNSKK